MIKTNAGREATAALPNITVALNWSARNPLLTIAYQHTPSVNVDPSLSPDGQEFAPPL